MSRHPLLSALFACALCIAGPAQGDPGFDKALDRAGDDPAALRERVAAEPERARAWFYAYVFDLATPGLSPAEKDRVRRRARMIADQLDPQGAGGMRVLVDGETDGRLAARAEIVRAAIDAVRRPIDALPLRMASSSTVRAVFYGLLHRAALSRNTLGGRSQSDGFLEASRLLASGWLYLTGRSALWQALPPEAIAGLEVTEEIERTAITALREGRAADALRGFERARQVELGQRGPGPRASLMRGGLAEAHLAAGDVARAQRERQAMLDELRAIGNPWLIARGQTRALEIRLDQGEVDLAPTLAPLLADARTSQDLDIAPVLLRAAFQLREAGEAQMLADDVRAGTLLDAASALYARLRDSGILDATVAIAGREAEARARAAAAARIDLDRARLADARGRIDDAWDRASAARPDLGPADVPGAEALLGRLALERGALDAALAHTAAAEAAESDPRARAENRDVRARLRLALGQAAPAFAWANAGLRTLRTAGLTDEARPLRVRLHHTAAAALWAAGYRAEAEQRLGFALAVYPATDVALDLAGVQHGRGDIAAARATLSRVSDPRTRVAAGCLAADDPAAVEAALAGIGPGIPSDDPMLATRAAICRAWARPRLDGVPAWVIAGSTDAAGPADAAALPRDVQAAIHTLIAGVGAPGAEAHRRAAIGALRQGLMDGRPRLPRLAGPASLSDAASRLAVDDWSSVLSALGATDLGNRRWRPPPTSAATDRVNGAIAAVHGRSAAWSRAARRAAEPADPDRVAAREATARAWAALGEALTAQAEAHPEWAALVRPPIPTALPPADGPRWIFRVGARAAHLWVAPADGGKVQGHMLPDRAALTGWVARLEPLLTSATAWPAAGGADPHRATWTALGEAADALIPAAARAGLDSRPLAIVADPPLDRLPLDALVLEAPSAPGRAPVFLATGRAVSWPMTSLPARAHTAGDPRAATVGLGQADAAALGDAAPPSVAAEAAVGAGIVHFGAPLDEGWLAPGAPALIIVDGPPPPGPLARWAGVGEILVGPRADAAVDARAAAHLWARLQARPLSPALVFRVGGDGAAGALLPAELARSAAPLSPAEAIRQWRLEAMTRSAQPGRLPTHHPSHWARWRRSRP